jgi:hypothetical protein
MTKWFSTNVVIRAAWRYAAKQLQDRLPEAARPTKAQLQPIFVRNAPKHPLHRIAYLKQQSQGRWYTTHANISAAVRRFTTSAARNSGVKYDKASFPKSRIGSIVDAQAGRAPFASTLRPNLTGGVLGRTAGGYGWGSGRAGGARYFSHGPAAPAQVINNVSQAVRAFLVGGNKAQFDGVNPHNGEKRFMTVSSLQDQVNRTLNKVPKATPGSYISFNINPTVTALTPLKGFTSFAQEKESLNNEGLLDVLSVDFSRAVKELAAVLNDLQHLAELGDLPISYEHSSLKVHFPGCDAQSVGTICNDFDITRGTVHQDADFDAFVGTDIALLFPFAPSRTPSECFFFEKPVLERQHVQPNIDWQHMLSPSAAATEEDVFSTESEQSYDQIDEFTIEEPNPWLNVSSPSGYDSLHTSEADEMDMHTPLEYQGLEGMYRFMAQYEAR